MLWLLICIILILWVSGTVLNVGALIHLLIVLALILAIYQLVTGRRVD